jgi:predicted acyltransferase
MKTAAINPQTRIVSLDQFRGYTIVGMFLVNFVGRFDEVHHLLKHHNTYNSYADTIMPHFFFAVGFAMRLGVLKGATNARMIWRCLGLVLLGLVVYQLDGNYRKWADLVELGWSGFLQTSFLQSPFQALVHIGLTAMWVLPVMRRRSRDLVIFAVGSGLLHLGLSAWFWFDFLMEAKVIDGGPLGFLTWSLPTLAGALAYDAVKKFSPAGALRTLLGWGVGLSVLGYLISCVHGLEAPPFFPPWNPVDMWTMSQRSGSISYQVFSAGFSLLVYALFLWWCDVRQPGLNNSLLRTFGTNALAGYVIHMAVAEAIAPFSPKDSPLYWVIFVTSLFFLITWSFVRALERRNIYLRM